MSGRLKGGDPATMSAAQRELYERFTTGPRAASTSAFSLVDADGRLVGPPAIWVLSPPLGAALEQLGAAVRFHCTLEPRAREIAILLVAHHHRSAFERHAHEQAGRAAGLSPEDLAALAVGQPPAFASDQEQTAYEVTSRVLASGSLSDAEYADAVAALGLERLVELVTLIGYYTMLAIQLSVFRVMPP